MRSNEELVAYLKQFGFLRTRAVEDAFRAVDRAIFVPGEYKEHAYGDYPLPILMRQTISAPSIVAMMTEALGCERGERVLEIGTGSGYQAAILSHIVGPRGRVFTIEKFQELVDYARVRLAALPFTKNVKVICADGSGGWPKAAPYRRIIVTAGAPEVPGPMIDQLADGGKMAIPVGSRYFQELLLIEKEHGEIRKRGLLPVMFVPLTGTYGFKEE